MGKKKLHDETNSLAKIGVTKIQSHRWQQIVSVSEAKFERHIAETKTGRK